ncbi:MAG: hypothetical protein AAGD06_22825, partial [Acidobacteriota bacterium]
MKPRTRIHRFLWPPSVIHRRRLDPAPPFGGHRPAFPHRTPQTVRAVLRGGPSRRARRPTLALALSLGLAITGPSGIGGEPPTTGEAFAMNQDARPPIPEPGTVADIEAGDPHGDLLELEAGRLVILRVEQLGADIALRLTGPGTDGGIEADSPTGDWDAEELAFVTPQRGIY